MQPKCQVTWCIGQCVDEDETVRTEIPLRVLIVVLRVQALDDSSESFAAAWRCGRQCPQHLLVTIPLRNQTESSQQPERFTHRLRFAMVQALCEQDNSSMGFGLQDEVQTPCVVHDGLQTSDAFEFDFIVCLSLFFAALQQADYRVDTNHAEFTYPAERIAGEGDTQRFEALVYLVWTVLVALLQVRNVVLGFLIARVGAVFQR